MKWKAKTERESPRLTVLTLSYTSSVPEVCVRFAVGDGATRRAATWKCWANVGSGKNDVYLANRHIAAALKASLHQSGNWHVAFDRGFLDRQAAAEEWPTRVVEQWEKPADLAPGFTLAYRIVTPSASVSVRPSPDEIRDVVWVAQPPDKRAVEIDVVITKPFVYSSSWPGHRSMNTGLVGRFTLDGGDTVWLLSRVIDLPGRTITFNRGRYFDGHTPEDLKQSDLRAIMFGTEPDGSRVMYDIVVPRQGA